MQLQRYSESQRNKHEFFKTPFFTFKGIVSVCLDQQSMVDHSGGYGFSGDRVAHRRW
jgi:hypothetical protein